MARIAPEARSSTSPTGSRASGPPGRGRARQRAPVRPRGAPGGGRPGGRHGAPAGRRSGLRGGRASSSGPTTGCLARAASASAARSPAVDLERVAVRLEPVSATFHGRDLFAPVAAHLAAGAPLDGGRGDRVGTLAASSRRAPRQPGPRRGPGRRRRRLRQRRARRGGRRPRRVDLLRNGLGVLGGPGALSARLLRAAPSPTPARDSCLVDRTRPVRWRWRSTAATPPDPRLTPATGHAAPGVTLSFGPAPAHCGHRLDQRPRPRARRGRGPERHGGHR